MKILDNTVKIERQDKGRVLPSASLLPRQIETGWSLMQSINLPPNFKKIKHIVLSGMGGSQLGAHLILSVFGNRLKIPFTIINQYQAPRYLTGDTLYIPCSYSGNTEEPLFELRKAARQGAKIFAITSGGILAKQVQAGKIEGLVYPVKDNPAGQPRMGVGYSVGVQLALMQKVGALTLGNDEFLSAVKKMKAAQLKYGSGVPIKKNPAKQLAEKLAGKAPVLIASEHLSGNAHTLANQLNETAKSFAAYHLIPELNHHLLEGLKFPKAAKKDHIFVFLDSALYHERNLKRFAATKTIIKKSGFESYSFKFAAKEPLEEALKVLSLGTYASFYLSVLHGVDPVAIPWVDFLKKQLK